ncbi:type IV secretion system protein [Bartonella sp. ML70XJBT]|uniref:type IV secretion system protein n=1 Tax=Bartonella sp. ML70XJBT TaxID=3019096 RepID=UPI002360CE1C|nr:type IV secretion system protein [Bartonella sp. ML70XJBT]
MKKRFIITGSITILAVLNLILTSNFSRGSENQSSTVQTPLTFSQADYLKIIGLLNQQIKTTKDQIENTKKIHQAITGNRIQKPSIGEDKSFFLQDSSIYPLANTDYSNPNAKKIKNYDYLKDLIFSVQTEEKRSNFWYMPWQNAHAIVAMRLKYSGIVDKAVSLQTFKDAEKRFTQIINFLNEIDKTKDLREVFELQARIKNMSAMLQNEYAKMQMVRNLSNNEELLIEIQKRKLYGKILNPENKNVPNIRFN